MNSLEIEGLKLEATEVGNRVTITWKGKSRHMNPGLLLDPYFTEISDELDGKELIVDFSQLETMNSSTVPPILSFIKTMEQKEIKTEIKYDGTLGWQSASFIPLSTITRNYKFVNVSTI